MLSFVAIDGIVRNQLDRCATGCNIQRCPYEIYCVQELVPRDAFCQFLAEDPTFIIKALFTHDSLFTGTEINFRKNHDFIPQAIRILDRQQFAVGLNFM
jgi:hypothetical protein